MTPDPCWCADPHLARLPAPRPGTEVPKPKREHPYGVVIPPDPEDAQEATT